MASASSSNSTSSLSRWKPAVWLVTGLAAAYGVYHVHTIIYNSNLDSSSPRNTLRRRNAVHRHNNNHRRNSSIQDEARQGGDSRQGQNATDSINLQDILARGPPDSIEERLRSENAERLAGPADNETEWIVEDVTDHNSSGIAGRPMLQYPPNNTGSAQDAGENQNLLGLLYHIAEDQAHREGYVHRGVSCNACGTLPIRGVRYRCSNCVDYDLCETCEAMQLHTKTHLFYKIRVPAPFLGDPRQVQPVFYPGKPAALPSSLPHDLPEKFKQRTGFDDGELDALYVQFRCLASVEWPDDPSRLCVAISRKTFNESIVANAASASPGSRTNLINDRIFAYYDADNNNLIGFEEFLMGLATLQNKQGDERFERAFKVFDMDNDGYIDRKDCLRIFRAYYQINKDLTSEVIISMEEDVVQFEGVRELIRGNQPISAGFSGQTEGDQSVRTRAGKSRDAFGDLVVSDGEPVVRDIMEDYGDRNDVIADAAQRSSNSFYGIGVTERGLFTDQGLLHSLQGSPHANSDDNLPFMPFVASSDVSEEPAVQGPEVLAQPDGNGQTESRIESQGDDHTTADIVVLQEQESDGTRSISVDPTAIQPLKLPPWVSAADVESVLGPVDYDPIQDGVTDHQVWQELIDAAHKRMDAEDLGARYNVRDEGLKERWRRSQFYTDSEEGAVPPKHIAALLEEEQRQQNTLNENTKPDSTDAETKKKPSRASNTGSNASTPKSGRGVGVLNSNQKSASSRMRSRSSSKVRFEDEEDLETRSNPSVASSRSNATPLGERWGGLEIWEPEKDVGKEILYQVTQQGFNELLDVLFKKAEDLAMEIYATKKERKLWEEVIKIASDESELDSEKEMEAAADVATNGTLGTAAGNRPKQYDTTEQPPPPPPAIDTSSNSDQSDKPSGSNTPPASVPSSSSSPSIAAESSSQQVLPSPIFSSTESDLTTIPEALQAQASDPLDQPNTSSSPYSAISTPTPAPPPPPPALRPSHPTLTSVPNPKPLHSFSSASTSTSAPTRPSFTPLDATSVQPTPERIQQLIALNNAEHEMEHVHRGPGRVDMQFFVETVRDRKELGFFASWIELGCF